MQSTPEFVTVYIDGLPMQVTTGTSVAAAVLNFGQAWLRRSVTGEPRGAVCGMGICYECRVSIDEVGHCRSCQTVCREGMKIST